MKYLIPLLFIVGSAFAQTTIKPLTQANINAAITDKAAFAASNDLATEAQAAPTSILQNKLLGRGASSGTGTIEEITLGTNLSLSGTTLNATGGGTVDNAALVTAMEEGPDAAQSAMQTDSVVALSRFRQRLVASNYTRPSILVYGDSMIGGTGGVALSDAFKYNFGDNGLCFATMSPSGGATTENDACLYWINGTTYVASGSGHTLTFPVTNGGRAGDTIKIYYIKQPGGGVFKVQTRKTQDGSSGAWTDETGYTTVSTDDTLAGAVLTITKQTTADYRAQFEAQVVWVSGGPCRIISGSIYHSKRAGALVGFVTNSSTAYNNLDAAKATPSAIINPILADFAPSLCVMSHLDGEAFVTAHQGGFQTAVNTAANSGAAGVPSWLIIGPPVGYDSSSDLDRAAQATAQRELAKSRGDAFYDNRTWALPVSVALSEQLITGGDPHYNYRASYHWVPDMFRKMGLNLSSVTGASRVPEINFASTNARIGASLAGYGTTNSELEITGKLRIANTAGNSAEAGISLEPRTGALSSVDVAQIYYDAGVLNLYADSTLSWSVTNDSGRILFYNPNSSTTTPIGDVGSGANPLRAINLGKKINAKGTNGNQTVNYASGRVWFEVGSAGPITITNSVVTSNSVILANIASDVGVDATAKYVMVHTIANGSFQLSLDAACTARTGVSFMVIP